ncbi:hypothetical protein EIP91_011293 [Steccherinum ochraceum]|uniref:DUF6534 domain-containing protein n=1 Tax=Steccherinum ochraceum TaxID=92696 RepID=A0A4R0RYK2_9APHY|nr:hypothetical protein EIP91_011293 [Steccherinum ochraceum]
MAIHSIYWYLIINSGRPQELAKIVWSGAATVLCEAVMVVLVHSFYIRRIYIMSGHKKWLIGILVAILFTRTTFSLASTTLMYTLGLWAAFTETTGSLFTVSMSLSLLAFADFSIAAVLMFYLWRSRTGFKKSDAVVHTLMAYCVNSGFLTMICSAMVLIMFLVQQNTLVFAGFVQVTSKLYANSLLGSLNMRSFLRDHPNASSAITFSSHAATNSQQASSESQIFQETSKSAYIDEGYGHSEHPDSPQRFEM